MRRIPIKSLGLITSTTTAARITAADASFTSSDGVTGVRVIGFQWISGTVVIGDATVTTARAGAFCELDTGSRLIDFRSDDGSNSLPIKDFWCVGTGTFIAYYQVY